VRLCRISPRAVGGDTANGESEIRHPGVSIWRRATRPCARATTSGAMRTTA